MREDFAIDLATVTEVTHGTDRAATRWRAESRDGTTYALKTVTGGSQVGARVTAHLATCGVAGVAPPVPTRDGRLWSIRGGRRLSVVPWVAGGRALEGMDGSHWAAYGALLAAVHAAPVPDDVAASLPREDHLHERVAAQARDVDAAVGAGPAPAAFGDASTDPVVIALRQEWRAAAYRVAHLLDHAERLGEQLRARASTHVVCHGDPHLGNLLVGDAGAVWLVDWDDAVLAPRERDLMFVLGGVLAFAPVTDRQRAWFLEGYGAVDPDPVRLAYHQCTRALEDVAGWAALALDVGGATATERREALSIVRGVLSPTGLVSIAEASVRGLDG